MVTIKIQHADDIIKAYLKALSYPYNLAAKMAPAVAGKFEEKLKKNDDIIQVLDNFLLQKTKSIFDRKNLNDAETIALFKFALIVGQIKDTWREDLFSDKDLNKDFVNELKRNIPSIAPDCATSKMKIQVIEPISPKSIFKRMFKKAKR